MKTALFIVLGVVLLAAGCGDADDVSSMNDDSVKETTVPGETSPAPEDEGAPESDDVPVAPIDESVLAPVTTKPVETAPEPTPSEGEPVPAIDHPNAQVVTAMTDLVTRLSVSPEEIEVVSVDEVTWRDGSIGCPEPGMRYTQALVNGSRIVLRVDGVDYQYNSGGGREPFYCANPSDPVPGGEYGDI